MSVDGHRVRDGGHRLDRAATCAVGEGDIGLDIDLGAGCERRLELSLFGDGDGSSRARRPDEDAARDRRYEECRDSKATEHGETPSAGVSQNPDR